MAFLPSRFLPGYCPGAVPHDTGRLLGRGLASTRRRIDLPREGR
jgi:hypothetical protein